MIPNIPQSSNIIDESRILLPVSHLDTANFTRFISFFVHRLTSRFSIFFHYSRKKEICSVIFYNFEYNLYIVFVWKTVYIIATD